INNVLKKVADLAERYGISRDDVQIAKMQRGAPSLADTGLPERVVSIDTQGFSGTLDNAVPCQIVGATVWAVHHAMKSAGDMLQSWFDVVLVDEASQLKLPDALIAFSASKPGAQIILAGDDRQLPPIIHGVYPKEHKHLLSSVFAFVRGRIDEQQLMRPDLEQRILFQLEENFRMNDVLTAYPRDVLYKGRFFSTKPDIRISSAIPLAHATDDLLEFLLHPDRPVLLVRYRSPRSFTARNPLEAEIAARFVDRLRTLLIDGTTGSVYTPAGFQREGVAILSPHRAQNSAIRQLLGTQGFGTDAQPMPLVDTVDKLQGQERDVVVVSYGVADGEYAEGEAEFLLSSNRFNVAATRARHKLVVLCADTVLDVVPTDQQVLLDAMMLKEFRRYCNSGVRPMEWTSSMG
ncbi:MAG TPA: DEAD/DEAH box helicase, partial [Roseiflexaceae bacterium]|nr:DEAD/DEAH box helicase [Roseiflexaceae bacterium]